jgi:hypothetical protein
MSAAQTPLQTAITRIQAIAKTFGFEAEGEYIEGDSALSFSTRANGDVGAGEPGDADIQAAKGLRAAIREEFRIPVALDTCDEWVEANIHIGDLQALLNGDPLPAPRHKP